MTKIYTKTGDTGTTSLVGGRRVTKDDQRVCAYGTVDELMAQTALLRDSMENAENMASGEAVPGNVDLAPYRDDLLDILRALMAASALLACDAESITKVPPLCADRVGLLEKRIDALCAALPPVKYFILPGGHPLVSMAHVCRTVCRRAEREVIASSREFPAPEEVSCYLNRLSDYFYALARKLSAEFHAKEIEWIPGER